MAHYKGAASEAGRAMQLLKKREQAQMEIEFRKKKIEEDLKISNIENKFAAHYDAVEQQLKTSTIGLVTLDEMKAKQENIVKERERKLAQKQAEKEREQQRQLEAKQAEKNRQRKQSLETDSDGDDDDDSEDQMETQDVGGKSHQKIKRKNKNRPQEISSKAPVRLNKKNNKRRLDPRFDSLCGEFDEKSFSKDYSFLDKIKEREHKKLIRTYKREKDPTRKGKVKFLLDRISNQKRSQKKNDFIKNKMMEEKQKYISKLKEGEKALFPRKTDVKVLDIVNDFENLQKSGKLKKYIGKKNKSKGMPKS